MLFNSFNFVLYFLPITFVIYFALCRQKLLVGAQIWLIIASLVYYSWYNIGYLPIILISVIVNYVIALGFKKNQLNPKWLLVLGITFNILLLGYFKYINFFISNFNFTTGGHISLVNMILPLGISFYTFQQIAYLVDSYRGEANETSVLDYASFILFFPQLIAGPISRYSQLMHQFKSKRSKILNYKNVATGLFLFSVGLAKKVIIADTFALYANSGYMATHYLSFFDGWLTSLSYTAQLYFDFSGYSDMAIGLGYLFNIHIPQNFDSPYKSRSIQEFWRRWHITLSHFLRDYIYFPLGGSRCAEWKIAFNLVFTFLLGGLWHGANWTFVLWGGLHGTALCTNRLWKKTGISLNKALSWFLTFNFVNISWVFFRAQSFRDAINVLSAMFGLKGFCFPLKIAKLLKGVPLLNLQINNSPVPKADLDLLFLALFLLSTLFLPGIDGLQNKFRPTRKFLIITILLMIFSLSLFSQVQEFLYFKF